MKKERKYTHVPGFTDYMEIVLNLVLAEEKTQKILDIPAGNGKLALKLEELGHDVTCGDINQERDNYIYADMEATLPFKDGEFDTVVCMEGIEHVLDPTFTISELSRICKDGGRVIVSVPNIQNLYSRFQFLCTGSFYQFPPLLPVVSDRQEKCDRGHIASLSFNHLRYLFSVYGCEVLTIAGDRYKKKHLVPFLFPFVLLGFMWEKIFPNKELENLVKTRKIKNDLFNRFILLSRSLIIEFRKDNNKITR